MGNVTQFLTRRRKPISEEISAKEGRIEVAKLCKAKIEDFKEKEVKIEEILENDLEWNGKDPQEVRGCGAYRMRSPGC